MSILRALARLLGFAVAADNSSSICSIVGRLDWNRRGRARVSWYSDTPMAVLTPLRAYSATKRFFSWQRIRPIVGWSAGWRSRSSTTLQ